MLEDHVPAILPLGDLHGRRPRRRLRLPQKHHTFSVSSADLSSAITRRDAFRISVHRRERSNSGGRVLATTFGGDHVDHDVETDAGTLVIRRPLGPTEEPWARGTEVEVGLVPEAVWAVRG